MISCPTNYLSKLFCERTTNRWRDVVWSEHRTLCQEVIHFSPLSMSQTEDHFASGTLSQQDSDVLLIAVDGFGSLPTDRRRAVHVRIGYLPASPISLSAIPAPVCPVPPPWWPQLLRHYRVQSPPPPRYRARTRLSTVTSAFRWR